MLVIPKGELVMKSIAMPADTNPNGDIFGGWLLSQMDLGGAVLAHKLTKGRNTTISIDKMTFLKPVYVGDIVSCYATLAKRGRTSLAIKLDVLVERFHTQELIHVTEGIFTYVHIDEKGKPTAIQWND